MNKFINHINKQILNNPNNIAIKDSEKEITYGELFFYSQLLEKKIKLKKGERVIIYGDKLVEYIVVFYTMMKLGIISILLDKKTPLERLKNLINETQAKLIFSDNDLLNTDFEYFNYKSFFLKNKSSFCKEIPKILNCFSNENDIAYIICTSGTTGIAKNVQINFSNIYNLVNSLFSQIYSKLIFNNILNIGVNASFSFDSSLKQIFLSLAYGYKLIIIPDKVKLLGRFLLKYLQEEQVDVIDFTPSLLLSIDMDNNSKAINNVKLVLVGGELFTKKHLDIAFKYFSNKCMIVNVYGPSECCVDVSYFIVPINYEGKYDYLPIGTPLLNNYLLIDPKTNELIICGENVGPGYLNSDNSCFYINENNDRCYKTGDYSFLDDNNLFYVKGRIDNNNSKCY